MNKTSILWFILAILFQMTFSSAIGECNQDIDCKLNNQCYEGTCLRIMSLSFSSKTIISLTLLFIAFSFGSMSGLLGTYLSYPILIWGLDYYPFEAILLISFSHLVLSLITICFHYNIPHPSRNCLAVDYNIILITIASFISGIMIGHVCNKRFPWFIISLSICTALIFCMFTLISRWKLILQDNIKEKHIQNENLVKQSNDLNSSNELNKNPRDIALGVIDREMLKENSIIQITKLKPIMITILVMLLLEVIKHAKTVRNNSSISWVLFSCFLLYAVIYTEITNKNIKREFQYKLTNEYPFNDNDIKWETYTSYSFAVIGLFSGVIYASGLDQGLVISSFLFYYRLSPRVIFASICFYEIITCSCGFLYFLLMTIHVLHLLPMFIIIGLIAISSAVIGNQVRKYLMKKYNQEELLIIASYNLTIVISTVFIVIYILSELIVDIITDRIILYESMR